MTNYMQHFDKGSDRYLDLRPHYPVALFEFLRKTVDQHELAWDCGTGNGQAAVELAKAFKQVVATDLSQAQLEMAPKVSNIQYQQCSVEKTTFADHSVDLVTIAQALHWFSLEAFYLEVKRVLKPKGIIAAWCYTMGSISPDIDKVVQALYHRLPWPPERRYIEEEYKTIPFPFEKIATPSFSTERTYNFEQFIGYLRTWSAIKEEIKQTGNDPLEALIPTLQAMWGDPHTLRIMKWPLHMIMGTISS